MKKLLLISFFAIISAFINAQDISGAWNGVLKVRGTELRIVFNLTKVADGFTATMDSPDQGAYGIPMTTAEFENNQVKLTHSAATIIYTGSLSGEEKITGTFTQGGQSFPMDLTRSVPEKKVIVRPQEPIKPYPYYSEDVEIPNYADSLTLAGTLTLPAKEGKYPAVILITGSGPQNRDEELLGHKPFLIVSDYLTRNGIAVLRYDDRGTAKSTGNFSSATSADMANDVEAAIRYLKTRKEINQSQIGLVGHSEGGIIAPMVAARSKDVGFIVLMAGTGVRGDELLLMQQEAIGRVSGTSEEDLKKMNSINRNLFDIVLESNNPDSMKAKLSQYMHLVIKEIPDSLRPQGMSEVDFIDMTIKQVDNPWMQYFIRHDPVKDLQKVKCPVLAINGSNDLQVPAKVNLDNIQKALQEGGNSNITIKEIPGLNHLFQESATGNPDEYAEIEQTFSSLALNEIGNWIKKITSE